MNAKQVVAFLLQFIKIQYLAKRFHSKAQLEQWQQKKIVSHLITVRSQSAFYQKWWNGYSNENWRSFPIMNKSIMMENFNELNTAGIDKQQALQLAIAGEQSRGFQAELSGITIGLSSGTSGNRGLFLVNEKERTAWAGTILSKMLPTIFTRKERIAFFLRANSELYQSVKQKRVQFHYYDLLKPLSEHITRLNATNPSVVVAPPSLLRMLAELQLSGDLQITPSKIISVAEVLDPLDRIMIEQSFHQTLHQIYQCTEGLLAATCAYGTLHLNEDILYIEKEYVDEGLGKFIPIITDFNRITQPIIRYRLDDILTESKEYCRCGSVHTAIESIDGRANDLFYIRSTIHNKLTPIFPDFISRVMICATSHIEEYEVVQVHAGVIDVYLRVHDVYRAEAEASVRRQWEALCSSLNIEHVELNFKPYTIRCLTEARADRKQRRIRREWVIQDNRKEIL